MKTNTLFVLSTLLVGCQGSAAKVAVDPPVAGPQGIQGLQGPQGPQGPVGVCVTKSLVYVDATGAVVGPNDPTLGILYVDANGLLWPVDASTGAITLPAGITTYWYDNDTCTGTQYVGVKAPRVPFQTSDGTILVVPDTLAPTQVATWYSAGSGSCQGYGGGPQYSLESVTPGQAIALPTVSFVVPLHMEYR